MKHFVLPVLFSMACAVQAAESAFSPLAVAAMERDFDTVRALLAERGADVNALGPYATPPLHWVVRVGEHELAQRLLELGADPNLANAYGLHPLHLAIANVAASTHGRPRLKMAKAGQRVTPSRRTA